MEVGGRGKIIYLSLHGRLSDHQNDSCIKTTWQWWEPFSCLINCEGQSHKTGSTDHNFWREMRAEADSNRPRTGPSAYQSNALPARPNGRPGSLFLQVGTWTSILVRWSERLGRAIDEVPDTPSPHPDPGPTRPWYSVKDRMLSADAKLCGHESSYARSVSQMGYIFWVSVTTSRNKIGTVEQVNTSSLNPLCFFLLLLSQCLSSQLHPKKKKEKISVKSAGIAPGFLVFHRTGE